MRTIIATCAALLLLSIGQGIAAGVKSVADLKADFGFAERRVTQSDLGLKDKEVLAARLFDGPMIKGKYSFDEKMLLMAIEGMINRSGPLIFLDSSPSGWRGDATWLKYYGETHGCVFVGLEQSFVSFVKKTAPVFNGIILFDPEPSDNYWLAMNLASLNFCLPVSRLIYNEQRECFGGLRVVMDVPARALSREEIYDWMIREILPKTDLTAAWSPACDFPDLKLYANWEDLALGADYPFYRRIFMFNLSPLPARMEGFMGSDGSPAMARQYREIMGLLKSPAAMFGWSVSEAEFSKYGHFQCNSVVAPNLSFHAVIKPIQPPPYRQDLRPRIEKPEKKVYLSFVANEGDTLVVLSQLYYGDGWLDQGRGRVALNWPMNPYYAKLFPALVEYYFRTKTDLDYFVCAPSGAGYVHPDSMKKIDLDRFIELTGRWMSEGITMSEIILWEGRDPAVQAAYANGIPNLRGLTIKPEELYPWGEMLAAGNRDVPVLREPIATQYWMSNRRFCNPCNAGYKVDVGEFLKYLDDLDRHVRKPYCVMVYGLQNNLPSEIVRIQEAFDRKRFEIVDMGTLCHLASFETPRIKGETAVLLDPRNYPTTNQAHAGSVPWKTELLGDPSRWKPQGGSIVTSVPNGLRVQIPADGKSALVELSGVVLPPSAKRVRIQVPDVQGCRWVLLLSGEFADRPVETVDIQGRREARQRAAWQPFSEWSTFRRFPGADDRPLDKAIISNNLQGRPVTLGLQLQGSGGGYAVFEKIEFTADQQSGQGTK